MTAEASPQRVMLVTGASRGIGRALAEHYTARGRRVVGCSRTPGGIDHPLYRHAEVDVTDEAAVRRLFVELARTGDSPAVVVNNAGIAATRLALLTGAAEADQVLRTNVLGTFLVTREAVKFMKRARFGRIVNFSSINVPLGSAGSAIYNASKAAVENLGLTLSREMAGDDITINTIGLSVVAGSGMAEGLSEAGLRGKQDALLKPALLDVAEVAHAIDFFAADAARSITAQTLYFGGVRG